MTTIISHAQQYVENKCVQLQFNPLMIRGVDNTNYKPPIGTDTKKNRQTDADYTALL